MTSNLLQSLPSPMKIREELERMVLKDLLGPVGGPEEEIGEQSVRDRYLVGMLAPKQQELSPEEFDELPQGGSGSVEDGTAESTSPAAKTMFPSSFGMTFCVGLETHGPPDHRPMGLLPTGPERAPRHPGRRQETRLEAVPAAGHLRADLADRRAAQLDARRRVPPGAGAGARPQAGSLLERHAVPRQRAGRAEEAPGRRLAVPARAGRRVPDRGPVFQSHLQRKDPGKADPLSFAEEQEMAMLYRHQVEFGVGHGVSIHAEPGGGWRVAGDGSDTFVTPPRPAVGCFFTLRLTLHPHARLFTLHPPPATRHPTRHRLSTVVVPTHEVPRTTPPTVADWPRLSGLVVDMKELGETPTPQLAAKLRPLLTAYAAWIDDRQADLANPDMAHYQTPGQTALDGAGRPSGASRPG